MDLHELQQENQALKYRNDKLKANYRKLQMNLSEKENRIVMLYHMIHCHTKNAMGKPVSVQRVKASAAGLYCERQLAHNVSSV